MYSCNTNIIFPDGGYQYPASLNTYDTSFYYYPVKKIISEDDSLGIANSNLVYKFFNETNLSLRPMNNNIFRLTSIDRRGVTIVTLTEGLLTIKEGNPDTLFVFDTTRLSEIENLLYSVGNFFYKTIVKGRRNVYVDSLIRLYPQLQDRNYIIGLRERIFVHKGNPFIYSVKKIPLSIDDYNSLINEINQSGYWSLPYSIECAGDIADGGNIILEANLQDKYNVASTSGCNEDNVNFTKVCYKILTLSGSD